MYGIALTDSCHRMRMNIMNLGGAVSSPRDELHVARDPTLAMPAA